MRLVASSCGFVLDASRCHRLVGAPVAPVAPVRNVKPPVRGVKIRAYNLEPHDGSSTGDVDRDERNGTAVSPMLK